MNIPNKKDYLIKEKKLKDYMEQQGFEAAILARRENFAWFSGGGDNKVLRNIDLGVGTLLITKEQVYLIAQYMDLDRIFDDELQGLNIEKICLKWFELSPVQKAMEIAGGRSVVADIEIEGAKERAWDIYWLHYPLTDHEIERYRGICSDADEILYQFATNINPGMTELEIEAELTYGYSKKNMLPKVLLVGSDERIERYRHPVASHKKVEKTVLMHVAAERNGLHVNLTRMISFDDQRAEELYKKYDLLNLLQAQAMEMTIPGKLFSDIFKVRKEILADYGYEQEWENHYPGSFTGYFLGSAKPFTEGGTIKEKMPTDYFITLRGAKAEELCISGQDGGELLSAGFYWPTKTYQWKTKQYNFPIILNK